MNLSINALNPSGVHERLCSSRPSAIAWVLSRNLLRVIDTSHRKVGGEKVVDSLEFPTTSLIYSTSTESRSDVAVIVVQVIQRCCLSETLLHNLAFPQSFL